MYSSNNAMLMTSIHAAFLFAIVSSPFMYSVTQKVFGGLFQVASSSGAPTLSGLLLHTIVFCLVTFATMWLHKKMGWMRTCACGKEGYMYDMEEEDMEYDMEDEDMEYDMEDSDNDNDLYDKSMDMYEDDFEDDDFEDDIEDIKNFFTGD